MPSNRNNSSTRNQPKSAVNTIKLSNTGSKCSNEQVVGSRSNRSNSKVAKRLRSCSDENPEQPLLKQRKETRSKSPRGRVIRKSEQKLSVPARCTRSLSRENNEEVLVPNIGLNEANEPIVATARSLIKSIKAKKAVYSSGIPKPSSSKIREPNRTKQVQKGQLAEEVNETDLLSQYDSNQLSGDDVDLDVNTTDDDYHEENDSGSVNQDSDSEYEQDSTDTQSELSDNEVSFKNDTEAEGDEEDDDETMQ